MAVISSEVMRDFHRARKNHTLLLLLYISCPLRTDVIIIIKKLEMLMECTHNT